MGPRRPTGNLPAEWSSFVGRRRELTEVRRLSAAARLVTLTGLGGVGKSRLARHAADAMRRSFRDGVWLVELAELNDVMLLPRVVSQALGISDQTARDQMEVLADYLADRQMLLILDNCEHLMPGCALLIAELLRAGTESRVLATSRAMLQIPGEQVYQVPPLAVPELDEQLSARARQRYPALALFAERASAVLPGFTLTDDNLHLVMQVCRRLDGIPLAIELAASRLFALPLEHLATLLEDRFSLLTSGNVSALPRHQTLRAAVEWSFELCTKPERLLWIRTSVFAGRFDLEAADRVCSGPGLPGTDVLEALTGLVDKSVLIAERDAGEASYRMLETVREYGLLRLRHPNDSDAACHVTDLSEPVLRRRHRDFYLDLAERFHADWFGPRQLGWTRRMCREVPNLRAALSYCLHRPDETQTGVRLVGALYYFWYGCGQIREGRLWLERLLAADRRPHWERMRALAVYARLLILQGVPAMAVEAARECLEVAEEYDDAFYRSHALHSLGLGRLYLGDLPQASRVLHQAVAVAEKLGPDHPARAYTTFAFAVGTLLIDEDPIRASQLFAVSQDICRTRGDQWWLGNVLSGAVSPALRLGDVAKAEAYGREALHVRRSLRDTQGVAAAVEVLAWVAAAAHDYPRAARLLGAAEQYWRSVSGSPFAAGQWRTAHDDCEIATRQALGADFDAQYRRGTELTLDEAVTFALGEDRPSTRRQPPPVEPGEPRLTPREVEVAELVAQGLGNKQIAARLLISQRTAESHVENLLTKLGFTSRSGIASWYTEHHRTPPRERP